MAKSISRKSKGGQRAVVIGVSDYPPPIPKLPAVANDVREMAKLLASTHGVFTSSDVTVLADKQASRQKVLSALTDAFGGASPDETIFVYVAGHGSVEGSSYYFVAHDTDSSAFSSTGVPLTEIKSLFDKTKSTRAFLWLDFCHSGGILARGAQADDLPTIQRALGVIQGQGKVILAACTRSQNAYESSAIGHGLFTHALLRGLRGEAKSAHGEVTAMTLYEFVDREVANPRQQPVFLGEMAGRIVLMHYPARSSGSPKAKVKKKPAAQKASERSKLGTWIMLGEQFCQAESIRHQADGIIRLSVCPANAEESAALAALRPQRFGYVRSIPFAANNDAHSVRVEKVESEAKDGQERWELSLKIDDDEFDGAGVEANYNVNGKTFTADDVAEMRIRLLLLNERLESGKGSQGFGSSLSLVEGAIENSLSRHPVRECVVQSVFKAHGENPNWREFARLKAIFLLKATRTVEHILELTIAPVRARKIGVQFRGRRAQRYSNVAPVEIEVSGDCPLD